MRFTRVMPGLLLLLSAMSGCSHTGALRSSPPDGIKTTASVGDKALPIVAGAPGSSLRADTADPDLPRASRGRISGRVYDEEGRPVSNARVRLALGAAPAGKAVYANTDRSGAFTLGGLRPGSDYTVIAEYQGEQGMMSGRVDTDAPDTDVRIGLHLRDVGIGEEGVRTAARPQRSKVKSISKVEEIDDAEEPLDETIEVNREDLPRPDSDDAVKLSRSDSRRPRATKAAAAVRLDPELDVDAEPDPDADRAEPRRGWSSTSRPSKAEHPAERQAGPVFEGDGDYEDDNPLPPAREVGAAGDRRDSEPARTASRPRRRSPARIADEAPPAAAADWISDAESEPELAAGDAPQPLPDGFGDGDRTGRSQGFGPITIDEPEPIPARPPTRAHSNPRRARPNDFPEVPDDDPQALLPPQTPRPTWSELARETGAIPLDEAIVKTAAVGGSATLATAGAAAKTRTQAIATSANRVVKPGGSLAPSLLPGRKAGPFCDFDASERRLIDFALPDAGGKMVSIRDLDADLILLDFWGTWCVKCVTSIPHLKELQAKLGGKRLQVVGIACEQAPVDQRTAKVSAVVKKMGINYTVLITGMDAKCPVQDAFQIRFYPTMILLDRSGRILCRQEGATAETLAKIDRYIAKNLDGGASTSTLAIGPGAARR